ncbi:hypothetical protein KC352_g34456, partial [Hortaea werneckii]
YDDEDEDTEEESIEVQPRTYGPPPPPPPQQAQVQEVYLPNGQAGKQAVHQQMQVVNGRPIEGGVNGDRH